MWSGFAENTRATRECFLAGSDEELAGHLSRPDRNEMFYGFDALVSPFSAALRQSADLQAAEASGLVASLILLAEAVGARPLRHPEHPSPAPGDADDIVADVERAIGFPIDFPNCFEGEFGLLTSRGVASYRAIQAIYQAHRLAELARVYGGRVVEIGGGLGRTAYYANRFGLQSYTIIDLPMTAAAQCLFLAQTTGVVMPGEAGDAWARVQTSDEEFPEADIVLNADSFPEIDPDQSLRYAEAVACRSKAFLSINHEFFPSLRPSVSAPLRGRRVSRHPYWLRSGYAEELFVFCHQTEL
jgi:hypothetical protein